MANFRKLELYQVILLSEHPLSQALQWTLYFKREDFPTKNLLVNLTLINATILITYLFAHCAGQAGTCYEDHAGSELGAILLPLSPCCWDYSDLIPLD